MSEITLKAHFDGERIVLDEPFELSPNTPLMVTVLSADTENELTGWAQVAAGGLARAYGDAELDYSAADLRT